MQTPLPSLEDVQRAVGTRYEVLELAGAGGMGAVFRARHRALGHLVAIKVLPPEVAASEVRRARFKREATLTARLSHPHIVPVYEFDASEELTYLVMPFVEGTTLEAMLAVRRRLAPDEVLRVVREVGSALDFAHRHEVVHRDVKPSNILLERDTGRALLTDFGVARGGLTPDGSLTAAGAAVGTPDYMAPEQVVAEKGVDARADLYALALVAFEALTGTLPTGRLDPETLAATLRRTTPRLTSRLASALAAPLAARPQDRPATAQAWLDALAGAQRARRGRALRRGVTLAVLLLAGWTARSLWRTAAPARATIAVMPFSVLGASPYPAGQLPENFVARFSPVAEFPDVLSAGTVTAATGVAPLSPSDAREAAHRLGATAFVQTGAVFAGDSVTLDARLYDAARGTERARARASGPTGALSDVMDAAWAQILGSSFAPNHYGTLPRGKDAIADYLNAEAHFRLGAYDRALEEYDRVIARDSSFPLARLRRALVIAQVDPTGERVNDALHGALRHSRGLAPADSVILDGYALLIGRGDGRGALARFRAAADSAPRQWLPWFVLGEFYTHFGVLYDQRLDDAHEAFNRALDVAPQLAPAVAHLVSLTYLRGDRRETRRLMDAYRALDSTSVVAQVIGVADTLLFGAPAARAEIVNQGLDRRPFDILAFLAYQAALYGSDADRQGPGRRVLRALERRAVTAAERERALRMGLAADLRYGWGDSARARLAATGPGAQDERDAWILLARATGLPDLGEAGPAASRLEARVGGDKRADADAVTHWLLALAGPIETRARHAARVRSLAAGGAALPTSLREDLDARRRLAAGDTAGALARWEAGTQHYAVLSVPYGLVASLWPLRLSITRVAAAAADTSRAEHACGSFVAALAYVDQVALPQLSHSCGRWLHR